ncbi:MAG: response regulator [Spirochaetaceae bacterium]|nr:response regulator [Spirochaetaceae bacterium]MDT8297089.1 response regulator [Spirochaetaceae bacterium]
MARAMIVDDAAIMRMCLKDILEPEHQVVAEAGDGEKALEVYAELKPDFVTLDITMPKLNGIEALEKLIAEYPEAKVIIVSAVGQKQLVFQALGLGVKDFIVKPFDPDRVRQSINRLFE